MKAPTIDPQFRDYLRDLDETEYRHLEADIVAYGCNTPLDVWKGHGILLDGHHRLRICTEHGIPYQIHEIDLPDRDAVVLWMIRNQLGRRNIGPDEFAYYLGKLYETTKRADGGHGDQRSDRQSDGPKQTAQSLAAEYGVAPRTVERAAEYAKAVEAKAAALEVAPSVIIADSTPRKQVIAEFGRQDSGIVNIHRSDLNEWYTPAKYIASARAVMGGIDVDPASNPLANETVGAAMFHSLADNGLGRPWPGRVWLNPPWGREQGDFIDSLVEQYAAGIVTQAVVLVNAHATEPDWFRPMWDHILCFTDHRINFTNGGGGSGSSSTHGSVFVYLGAAWDAFVGEFAQWGHVVSRVTA